MNWRHAERFFTILAAFIREQNDGDDDDGYVDGDGGDDGGNGYCYWYYCPVFFLMYLTHCNASVETYFAMFPITLLLQVFAS